MVRTAPVHADTLRTYVGGGDIVQCVVYGVCIIPALPPRRCVLLRPRQMFLSCELRDLCGRASRDLRACSFTEMTR